MVFLPVAAVLSVNLSLAAGGCAGRLVFCLAASGVAVGGESPADPLRREIYNLKVDRILSGMWIALMGVNMLPAAALFMMMSMRWALAGGGGYSLPEWGFCWHVMSEVTLQLTGLPSRCEARRWKSRSLPVVCCIASVRTGKLSNTTH